MASTEGLDLTLPPLPTRPDQFLEHVETHPQTPMPELIKPYLEYDSKLRMIFAQQPNHSATNVPNVVSVFSGHEKSATIRARDLEAESTKEKEQYIMPLKNEDRKAHGSPAIVQSLRDFRGNFNIFSESSLVDLDWSNVVVAGSAVVTSLLPVPEKHAGSKRALRQWYHEKFAPASDVDLFLYGLTEEQAVEKIKQIEQSVRDALLVETTIVRTKYAVTIVSQYPTRHVQIVLRVYKSISEILTSFDIDSSCAAYDGSHVYACPRALAAYMTQINTIDLSRRSPSYESRLSKYAKRGFEVFWKGLDRSKVDPTIFERSFGRTEGLARLLILEKLPTSSERDSYLDQRRAERGRPAINRFSRYQRVLPGDIKADWEDEVAEWVDSDEVSSYRKLHITYPTSELMLRSSVKIHSREWNKPKDREVNLHRHPAFFGSAKDILRDCCGFCPVPSTIEEEEVAEKEREIYISGTLKFIMDNPGRQQVGSFNPLSPDDWTEMAYVSNTFTLCQAILDGDCEFLRAWLEKEGNNPNARDWTGRAPLHLAAANSTVEIVQLLVDHGARLVARLADGRTALHLAAVRGSVEIVSALLRKSEANAEEEERRVDARRAARKAAKANGNNPTDVEMADASRLSSMEASDVASDIDMVEDADDDEKMDVTTEQSMVNIRTPVAEGADNRVLEKGEDDDPDVYDVDVVAWDTAASALHLAIIKGHVNVVKCLVSEFGADILLPIKLFREGSKTARDAILTLVLALQLPLEEARRMTNTLIGLGATVAQADIGSKTAFHYCVVHNPDLLETYGIEDETGVSRAINHLTLTDRVSKIHYTTPFLSAVRCRDSLTALKLLTDGAKGQIDFSAWMKAVSDADPNFTHNSYLNRDKFGTIQDQPVITAVFCELPQVAKKLIEEHGIDVNTISQDGHHVLQSTYSRSWQRGQTLLDLTRDKLARLRKWKPAELNTKPPAELEPDEHYLAPFKKGTYAHWSATCQLNAAKKTYQFARKSYEDAVESHKQEVGSSEKQAAVAELIDEFEALEDCLKKRSAQTFAQLYPEIQPPRDNSNTHDYNRHQPPPFGVEFSFKLPGLTKEAEQRYVELFEAAWAGNVSSLKKLTLTTWQDENGRQQPPLQVAIEDRDGISLLVIAALQGNLELVRVIMEIARDQYAAPGAQKNQRFRMRNEEEDNDSEEEDNDDDDDDGDDDGDSLHIESEDVDEEFTIDNVGQVSMQVQSRTTPLMLLTRQNITLANLLGEDDAQSSDPSKGFSFFGPRKAYTLAGKRSSTGTMRTMERNSAASPRNLPKPSSLIQWAFYTANIDCLVNLLDLGEEYLQYELKHSINGHKPKSGFFSIHDADFKYAIKTDRPELLEEITRRTGAGLPLQELLAKSGVEVPKERPEYYQGLSVHGRKRKDWVNAGRNSMQATPVDDHRPPLLEAVHAGSLRAAEWFSSNASMRCYKDFAEAHKDQKLLQHLALAKGGFEASAEKFLAARSHLAIHSCLMGNKTADDSALLKYLISSMPASLDAKSRDGLTPLHVAFQLFDDAAVRLLIDAGADQTARDSMGNNIVHHLLKRSENEKTVTKLPQMLDLIDKRVLPSLMVERCSEDPGALTPLAYFCASKYSDSDTQTEIVRIVIKYSEGKELSMINGEGDTPLHVAVRKNMPQFCKVILDHDSTLLLRENSTGRTPYEMAEDSTIMSFCEGSPLMTDNAGDLARVRARRLGLPELWSRNLVDRAESAFVENKDPDRRSRQEKVWDLVRQVKAQLDGEGHSSRRLVTLHEANEVARRLAAKHRVQGSSGAHPSYAGSNRVTGYDGDEGEKEGGDAEQLPRGGDEVQVWLSMARMSLQEADDSPFGSDRGSKMPRKQLASQSGSRSHARGVMTLGKRSAGRSISPDSSVRIHDSENFENILETIRSKAEGWSRTNLYFVRVCDLMDYLACTLVVALRIHHHARSCSSLARDTFLSSNAKCCVSHVSSQCIATELVF
nr:uncharacterized protein CFP56_53310 [Quercus suber]